MSFQLNFQKQRIYNSLAVGITLDTILRYGDQEVPCVAKFDTGSDVCLFECMVGDLLEIDIESGYKKWFSTLAGNLLAYGHEVELETVGLRFQPFVYFPESYAAQRNLLDRQGWLQLVKLGLIDYDGELYLSPYSE